MKNEIASEAEVVCLQEEPYVELADGTRLNDWGKEEEVLYNQQLRQSAKYRFYQQAFEFIRAHDIPGDYLEFGCHKARTFRMALTEARRKNLQDMRFLAFDSFEGLPDSGECNTHSGFYSKGALSTGEEAFMSVIRDHRIYVDRVRTIPGFYQQSLTPELRDGLNADAVKIALVTLDCSLYESFQAAFSFIEPFMQEGTIVYVDDYRAVCKGNPGQGAAKAFREFAAQSTFSYEPFLDAGWFGRSFIAYRDDGEEA